MCPMCVCMVVSVVCIMVRLVCCILCPRHTGYLEPVKDVPLVILQLTWRRGLMVDRGEGTCLLCVRFFFYLLPMAPVAFKETLDGWPPPVSSAG